MSRKLSTIRANIVAALQTLVGDSATVRAIVVPTDIWAIGGRAIGVCRVGMKWAEDSELNWHVDQPAVTSWAIVIKVDPAAEHAEQLTGDDQIEELLEAVFPVRAVNVGTAETGEMHLDAKEEQVLSHPDRTAGGSGPMASVLILRSTEMPA